MPYTDFDVQHPEAVRNSSNVPTQHVQQHISEKRKDRHVSSKAEPKTNENVAVNSGLRVEFDELRGRMDALVLENYMLRHGRSTEVYDYSLRIEELEADNQDLSSRVDALLAAEEQHLSDKALLRDEIAFLQRENEHHSAVIKDLELRCVEMEEQIRSLERIVEKKTSELAILTEEKV